MIDRRRFLTTALAVLTAPVATAAGRAVSPRRAPAHLALPPRFAGDPLPRPELLPMFNPRSTWRRGPAGEYVGPMSWQQAFDGLRALRVRTLAEHPGGGFLVFDEILGLRLNLDQYRAVLRARGANVT